MCSLIQIATQVTHLV